MKLNSFRFITCLFLILYSHTSISSTSLNSSEDFKNLVNYYSTKNDDINRFLVNQDKANPLRGKDLKSFFSKEKILLKSKMPKLEFLNGKILLQDKDSKLTFENISSKSIDVKSNGKVVLVKSNMTTSQMKEALGNSKISASAVIVSLELFDLAVVIARTNELLSNFNNFDKWCISKSFDKLTDDDRKILLDYIHKLFDLQLRCDKVTEKDPVFLEMCDKKLAKTVGCYEVLLKGPKAKH